MENPSSGHVTRLLNDWSDGDSTALDELMPILYDELRSLAAHYLRRERADHTLQPTALVHEAYFRLVDQNDVHWQNRAHFFGVTAQMMRRVLIDHAKSHRRAKRGGGIIKVDLDQAAGLSAEQVSEALALDDVLDALARIDPRKGKIVELRYFGGLSVEETAEVLGISPTTVMRDWALAKAWLYNEIKGENDNG
ncbi:MAG: sigma-70 family RNA polymerase sigma factor [Blastocatellia bacterium]|nr:sigma-70 family RNA polymerase sigma factor [Blastocatellia bacterium]